MYSSCAVHSVAFEQLTIHLQIEQKVCSQLGRVSWHAFLLKSTKMLTLTHSHVGFGFRVLRAFVRMAKRCCPSSWADPSVRARRGLTSCRSKKTKANHLTLFPHLMNISLCDWGHLWETTHGEGQGAKSLCSKWQVELGSFCQGLSNISTSHGHCTVRSLLLVEKLLLSDAPCLLVQAA